MSTQARPKYVVEEYPLVFSFPASVTTVPEFTVEVLSGQDPNKDALIGLHVVSRNLVAVFISGGLAGCIYRIYCVADEIEKYATVAVLPTEALAPAGGNLPFTFRRNTLPYPVIYYDDIDLNLSVLSGSLDTLVVQSTVESDAVSFGFSITGGTYKLPPTGTMLDSVDLEFSVLSGELAAPPSGDYADDLTPLLSIEEGILGPAPTGTFIDDITLSLDILGGSLSVP